MEAIHRTLYTVLKVLPPWDKGHSSKIVEEFDEQGQSVQLKTKNHWWQLNGTTDAQTSISNREGF